MSQVAHHPIDEAVDFLPLRGIDHIEFCVGNAKQAAYFYRSAFGMQLIGYRGPETGTRETASYLLEQGRTRFVLTTPLTPDHFLAGVIGRHGDGVRDIAMEVENAELAWRETTRRGAQSVRKPETLTDDHGSVALASIGTYGETIHTFVERSRYQGLFLPGFVKSEPSDEIAEPCGLTHVDHIVGNVELGRMDEWVKFYERVMGFRLYQHFDDKDVSTEYSALMSKVLAGGHDRIKFPINEPAEGRRKSQIEEYLEFYRGPGVQHIALHCRNIIDTVSTLRRRGIEFLKIPSEYYRELTSRVGPITEPLHKLEELGILVDRDDEGYMLQIFTAPVEDRPTLFFEIIQRKGSRSFGKGNFKALFEAIEREQARRGNL
jgi:4-hydroxyphenylpyruvate dioxygenase